MEMKYSSLTDTIILRNRSYGAENSLSIADSNGVLASLGLTAGTATAGKDAKFDLDGTSDIVRSSNAFTIEGNAYTLKKEGVTSFTVSRNTDEMVAKIKNFVTKYNELIEKINGKYNEKYDKSYQPLTDAQKESMDSDTVTKWENKAKTGLLNRDGALASITSSMRSVLIESVTTSGGKLSLADIGISSTSYTDQGKLKVDEAKLRESLSNRYSDVVTLFTKESTTNYSETLDNTEKRSARKEENGISYRLFDIIQDNIRTTGGKGSLLTKAGMVGDVTEYTNQIYTEMQTQATTILTLTEKLTDKETKLYTKFATLEKAMSRMQSQSSWLAAQTGTN